MVRPIAMGLVAGLVAGLLAGLAGVPEAAGADIDGRAVFERAWGAARDGPHRRSCASCHAAGGRSAGVHATGVPMATRTLRYADGRTLRLQRPVIAETDRFGPRAAPTLWVMAAIEAVPEDAIRAWEDPDDRDGDGVSGRARRTMSLASGEMAMGRFGWKATAPALADQVANAFATDMGISNPLILAMRAGCADAEGCFAAAAHRGAAPADPREGALPKGAFEAVVAHVAGLSPPPFAGDAALWARGLALFDRLGCAACHRRDAGAPFTDLLLHDMGDGLADTRPQGSASAREWRTAPLLGLGATRAANAEAGYLHDGRALTVEAAILWHGGEALGARDAFAALPAAGRARLIAFLEAL